MKVLIVVSTLNTGGAQKVAAELSNMLSSRHQVDFLLNDDSEPTFPFSGNIISLGLQERNNKTGLFYQAHVLFSRVSSLRRIKHDYDFTISFMDSANYANIISGNRYSKVICTVHCALSATNNWKYKYIVIPINKLLYKFADQVITVSKGIEYDFVEKLGYHQSNILTIYNGMNIEKIQHMSLEPFSGEESLSFFNGPTLATIGRLCEQKGQWHLIRAMKEVVKAIPDVRLLILGEGEYRKYLEGLIEDLALQDNVFLLAFRSNPYPFIRESDIFVLPSLWEGLPTVLIEAISLSKPCIATDFNSGAREILAPELSLCESLPSNEYHGKYGIITPVCDGNKYGANEKLTSEESSLANAIINLLNDSKERAMYVSRAAEAINPFESNTVLEQWEQLFKELKP